MVDMLRSALAICVPFSAAIAIGDRGDGVLAATGGLLGTMVDSGGPYLAWVRRVATAGIVGGGGLAIGTLASGRAGSRWSRLSSPGVAAVLATLGGTGSATRNSVACLLLAQPRPGRPPAVVSRHDRGDDGNCLGAATHRPGWLLTPRSAEEQSAAAVYHRLADDLRAIGTPLEPAAITAAISAGVPYGPWLLIPMALFAAPLPYDRSLSFGLTATLLTPLVVMLIDLLAPIGWRLTEHRLADTVLGCAIVLLFGYAPWPSSWQQHLPAQFADTVR